MTRDLRRHGQGDRPRGPAGRGCTALRAAQAGPPTKLSGTGLSPGGLPCSVLLPACHAGGAQRNQSCIKNHRDPGADLGRNQQSTAGKRQAREVGRRQVVRVDSTVTSGHIHELSDSSLLWDAGRVMVRLLLRVDAPGSAGSRHDHCRAAKKRSRRSNTFEPGDQPRLLCTSRISSIERSASVPSASRLAFLGASMRPELRPTALDWRRPRSSTY